MRKTINDLKKMKAEGKKIAQLTAYDYTTAKIIDSAGIDMILVGDSLGNVAMGYSTTIPVTMDDMVHHSACVSRGCDNAFLVCDMPFMSYQADIPDAVKNAGRLIKEGGANAVKLEGGVEYEDTIRAIVNASIPVVAHIGLTPQSVNTLSGYKVQGKTTEKAEKLIKDAKAIKRAGAFACTLECVPSDLAKYITEDIFGDDVISIGIGAGKDTDAQVLVYADMCGLNTGRKAKFVKTYANMADVLTKAVKDYMSDVESGEYPSAEYGYKIDSEVMDKVIEKSELEF